MTDLTARIAAHPVAAAMAEYKSAQASVSVRLGAMTADDRDVLWGRLSDAEAALVAALDAEDALRTETLAELRRIHAYVNERADDEGARHQYTVEVVIDRLAALIAQMEG